MARLQDWVSFFSEPSYPSDNTRRVPTSYFKQRPFRIIVTFLEVIMLHQPVCETFPLKFHHRLMVSRQHLPLPTRPIAHSWCFVEEHSNCRVANKIGMLVDNKKILCLERWFHSRVRVFLCTKVSFSGYETWWIDLMILLQTMTGINWPEVFRDKYCFF